LLTNILELKSHSLRNAYAVCGVCDFNWNLTTKVILIIKTFFNKSCYLIINLCAISVNEFPITEQENQLKHFSAVTATVYYSAGWHASELSVRDHLTAVAWAETSEIIDTLYC